MPAFVIRFRWVSHQRRGHYSYYRQVPAGIPTFESEAEAWAYMATLNSKFPMILMRFEDEPRGYAQGKGVVDEWDPDKPGERRLMLLMAS